MPFHLVRSWSIPMHRDALWNAITDTSAYQDWWSWLGRFDAVPIEVGARTEAVITAPLPYDLRLRFAVIEVKPAAFVRVALAGDLAGEATLELQPDDDGVLDGAAPATIVRLTCDAEAVAPALRLLDRAAHPVLVWGHRVVADRAVKSFVAAQENGGRARSRTAGMLDTAIAAVAAGTVSGLPSTVAARAKGRPLLDSTRAAGTLVGPPGVIRGAAVHGAISTGWSAILMRLLPRRHTIAAGAAAGLAIGLVDLGVVGRRYPAIRALPRGPQLADHVVFGATVGVAARLLRDRH